MVEDLSAMAAALRGATVHVENQAAAIPEIVKPVETPIVAFEIPAVVWRADATTLAFQAVSVGAESLLGYPSAHWLETAHFFAERIHPEERASKPPKF